MALVPAAGAVVASGAGKSLLTAVISGVAKHSLPVLKKILYWYGNAVHQSLAIQLNRQFSKYGQWVATGKGYKAGYTFIPHDKYAEALGYEVDLENLGKTLGGIRHHTGGVKPSSGTALVPSNGPKIEEIDMSIPTRNVTQGRYSGPKPRGPYPVPTKSVAEQIHIRSGLNPAARQVQNVALKREAAKRSPIKSFYKKAKKTKLISGKARMIRRGSRMSGHTTRWAPRAVGGSFKTSSPRFGKFQKDLIQFSKVEYLGPITSTTNYTLHTYEINPGIQATFPFLSQFAKLFQEYVFNRLTFYVRPRTTTAATGGIFQCFLSNIKMPAPANLTDMMTISGAKEAPVWDPKPMRISKEDLQLDGPTRNIRTGALGSEEDAGLYDPGRYFYATQGATSGVDNNAVAGDLFVTYDVTLLNPTPLEATLQANNQMMSLVNQRAALTYGSNDEISFCTEDYDPDNPSQGATWHSTDFLHAYWDQNSKLVLPQGDYVMTAYFEGGCALSSKVVTFTNSSITLASGTVTWTVWNDVGKYPALTPNPDATVVFYIYIKVSTASGAILVAPSVDSTVSGNEVSYLQSTVNRIDPSTVSASFPSDLAPGMDAEQAKEARHEEIVETKKEVDDLKSQLESLSKLVATLKVNQDNKAKAIADSLKKDDGDCTCTPPRIVSGGRPRP